ncbi:MAG TPA: GNAT family N-acetyltransferase [Streptosporangiaceae bacterium]|nr:GNAT family N-acetyltransferase [Streptosporangiaceae bacterium]
MRNVKIRDALPGDIAVLRDVFRRSSLSNDGDRPKLLANPDVLQFSDAAVIEGRVRAAIRDDAIIGFATWLPAGAALELEDLFVDPDQMRLGAGRALLADITEIARGRGAARIEVTANQHARAFYTKVGFVVDDYVQTTFGPALRMHLELP